MSEASEDKDVPACETKNCHGTETEKKQDQQLQEKQTAKPAKKPAEVLCNCPQKCQLRVPFDIRQGLFKEFSELRDHFRQNQYLQSYIEMRSVYKRLWCQEERVGGRLQRRVSCKYRIPLEVPKQIMKLEDIQRTQLQTNSKGKTTYALGINEGIKTIEVCQKAFMNVYGITEKRIRLQREKLIAKLRSNSMDATNDLVRLVGPKPEIRNNEHQFHEQQLHAPSVPLNEELTIVDTFFRNQLWKPEYIGIPCDKLQYLDVYHNDVKA